MNFIIDSPEAIERTVEEFGFLPYFANKIPGFSIEEHTPSSLWFVKDVDGPWEWKGPIVSKAECAYAKLFESKAVYVSREWFPHLVNFRRAGYVLSYDEERVLTAITSNESMLTTEIRDYCGFSNRQKSLEQLMLDDELARIGGKRKSLDSILSKLQMTCHIIVSNFEYKIDKHGRRYGWGVARYSTPEIHLADWFALPNVSPEESRKLIYNHLASLFPGAPQKVLDKILGKMAE